MYINIILLPSRWGRRTNLGSFHKSTSWGSSFDRDPYQLWVWFRTDHWCVLWRRLDLLWTVQHPTGSGLCKDRCTFVVRSVREFVLRFLNSAPFQSHYGMMLEHNSSSQLNPRFIMCLWCRLNCFIVFYPWILWCEFMLFWNNCAESFRYLAGMKSWKMPSTIHWSVRFMGTYPTLMSLSMTYQQFTETGLLLIQVQLCIHIQRHNIVI